ncbi:MAG: nucleotidyl transferase AbiEii/AbiGii toxin family protein [Rhodobacteraceae bacterium]|nr:nucleotidyl transferase AbiEii/AbiGii toxin family protein [Paracoccaceae bacterium]MCY4198052.1 nucleotidyl transferase AbiEii/AbiGii toxin family protein [Paracoccaceae bacterium]
MEPAQIFHQRVMYQVTRALQERTPYVLKGGTGLLFARNLDRHSTDLDFDTHRAVRIEEIVRHAFKKVSVKLLEVNRMKDSHAMQRFKFHYHNAASDMRDFLKIETKTGKDIPADMIETVNKVRTYTLLHSYDQKVTAFQERTAGRDLYDLSFLTRTYANQLTDTQIATMLSVTEDVDWIEERFALAWRKDAILFPGKDLEQSLLELRLALEHRRDNPPPPPVAQEIPVKPQPRAKPVRKARQDDDLLDWQKPPDPFGRW